MHLYEINTKLYQKLQQLNSDYKLKSYTSIMDYLNQQYSWDINDINVVEDIKNSYLFKKYTNPIFDNSNLKLRFNEELNDFMVCDYGLKYQYYFDKYGFYINTIKNEKLEFLKELFFCEDTDLYFIINLKTKSIIKTFYKLYKEFGLDYLINHPKYRSMYLYLKILKIMIENNISDIKAIKFYLIRPFKDNEPIKNKSLEYHYINFFKSSLYGLNSCIINELKFRIDNKHLYTNINNYEVSQDEMITALKEIKENLEEIKTDTNLKNDPVILFNYHNAYINVLECMYKLYFKNFFEPTEMDDRIKTLYTQIKELFLCIN